jgi:molybdopterin-guanine dinucleotide biosynthesis protein A
MALLFFRALCDMGIGLRFVFNFAVNYTICDSSSCHVNEMEDINAAENKCGPASGVFEFFEMASEAWFFCLALDLIVSITNPFSSFKQR